LDDRFPAGNGAALAHVDGALEHKDQTRRQLARFHDQGAVREMANLAEAFQPRDILLIQLREHLVTAGFKNGSGGFAHGSSVQKRCASVIPELPGPDKEPLAPVVKLTPDETRGFERAPDHALRLWFR